MWQLPSSDVCLQRLFEERELASQVSFQQEKSIHCSSGQPIKRYVWLAWKKGEEGWPHRSPHWGTTPCDESSYMMFVHPKPMRHIHLFAYLLLLATREWPHSESKSTLGQVEIFYYCISSDTSIPIALTKQVTQLALMSATLGSLPAMVPRYPSLDHFMDLSSGSLFPPVQSPPDKLLLVCGKHPQSCHPGVPIMWEIGSCQKEIVLSGSSKTLPICLILLQYHQHSRKQFQSCLPGPTPVSPALKKTVRIKSTEDLIKMFPDRFQGIGQFPSEYTTRVHDSYQPVIHAPQKCPISIYPRVKAELDKMVKLCVITPVDEPTDTTSSVAYAWKASGELCHCFNPHDLNNIICRDHHCTPTVGEEVYEFAHSKSFMKLDARHGYQAVVIDSKSSLLTTFNIPYGWYHFFHLPLGLACFQDIFQKSMHQILEEWEG